jgi:hypothetical protein
VIPRECKRLAEVDSTNAESSYDSMEGEASRRKGFICFSKINGRLFYGIDADDGRLLIL